MDNDAPVGSSAFTGGDLTALARRHHGAAGSAGDASQPHRKHIDAARSNSYPTSTSSKLTRRRKCTDLANDDFPHEQYDNGLLPPPPSPLPQNVFGGPPQSRETEPIDDATMEAHIASPTTARTDFSSTAMPDEHAAHHAPTVSDIRNQDARLVDARHAWGARTVTPSASRACEFHDSDDDADSLVELLSRESSPGLSPAGVGGSQGRRHVSTHHKWTNASLRAKKTSYLLTKAQSRRPRTRSKHVVSYRRASLSQSSR